MVAALIVSIIAMGFGAGITQATKRRMEARLRDAAVIEANSCMELVLAKAGTNVLSAAPGFISISTNDFSLAVHDTDPGMQWVFDNASYPERIDVDKSGGLLGIEVRVFCNPNRPVILYGEVYVKP